jgi:hypothetical protein
VRSFQYGLAGAELVSGNAHRIIWTLGTGWVAKQLSYRHTNCDTGVETEFTVAQMVDFVAGEARLFCPDFVWDRTVLQRFFVADSLPALSEDTALTDYAGLAPARGNPRGSVRMVNDKEILKPLNRFHES